MTVERMSIPLHSGYSTRDRAMPTNAADGYMYNAYIEKAGNGELYVKKRPALVSAYAAPAAAQANGLFWWEKLQSLLHVWGNTLYYSTSTSLGTLTSNTGKVSFCEYGYGGTLGNKVYILTHGPTTGQLWEVDYAAPSLANVAGFGISRAVPGLISIDGYLLALGGLGGLYCSNLGAPTVWTGTDVVYADQETDVGVYLAKHHNHAAALGARSIEFFFNAGLPTGSPFQRRTDATIAVGCHHSGSVAHLGDKTFFLAKETNSDPYVAVLDNFRVTRISTAEIERRLHKYYVDYTADTCSGAILNIAGKNFYVLSMIVDTSDTADGVLKTFVYDIDLGVWSVWAGAQDAHLKIVDSVYPIRPVYGSSGSGVWTRGSYVQADLTYQAIYYPAYEAYQDSISGSTSNYTVEIVTPKVTGIAGQGHRRKFLSELNLMGKRTSGTVDVHYSDDDYATWSTAQTLSVNPEKKLYGLGSFYERAFKIVQTANEDLRVSDMELALEYGRR